MSEQQEMMTPVPADNPTTRRYSLLRGVAVGSLSLLVVVTGVALYLTGRGMAEMDTRLGTAGGASDTGCAGPAAVTTE